MKDVLQNKWFTISAAVVVVALSVGCFYKFLTETGIIVVKRNGKFLGKDSKRETPI